MRFLICILPIFFYHFHLAQDLKPIQFGTVTTTEMKMSVYERDSTAPAVILHDKGYFNGNEFQFTRHVRIKILSAAGTSFGNFTIRVPSKSFIDGYTFNMESALLRKTKLERSNIYNEEVVDGFDVYKVFFPEVKPGSVIDLRYSHMGLPLEWRFQDVIPVRYSELTLEPTNNVFYKKVFYGFEKVSNPKPNQFVAQNVPAIALEPMMNHYSNYLTRFQFDIESISYPRWMYYHEFSTKWEMVGKRLMEHEFFGGVINGSAFLNEKAKEIARSDGSVTDKVTLAFDYIQDNIKWNHNFGLVATKSFREDFKVNHSGNSATINLLLIALLKKAGIEAYPVVLSTRDNGMINPLSASLNKLNYVMAYVIGDDISMFVDATNRYTMPGVVPEHCLNNVGWVIRKGETGQIIDLKPKCPNTQRKLILIKPDENNELVAEVNTTYEGYAYLDWVEKFETTGSEKAYLDLLIKDNPHSGIDGYTLVSQDKDHLKVSERTTLKLSGSDRVMGVGDNELLISPFILNDLVNPFKSGQRRFPIDFIYPRTRAITVSLELPKGYELKSTPQSSRVDYPGEKAKFTFLVGVNNNNSVSIRCNISVAEPLFLEDEHEILKAFFSEVVKKLNESVEIIRKT